MLPKARFIVVIPARFSSTRFPGKPLANILGRPLIWWVWSNAQKCQLKDDVLVATDDERIKKTVEGFGGKAILTSKDHPTGTDRIAEVAQRIDGEFFINLQGDEPLIKPGWIDLMIKSLIKGDAPIVTLATRENEAEEWFSPNTVKVVLDDKGYALYFSRAPIPFLHPSHRRDPSYLRHIGIYGFERGTLLEFVSLKQGRLESREGLEQLRALERRIPIKVIVVEGKTHPVDTPEDIKKVEQLLKRAYDDRS